MRALGLAMRGNSLLRQYMPVLRRGSSALVLRSLPRRGLKTTASNSESTVKQKLLLFPRIIRETFFHAPIQTLVGVCIGGLGASVAGMLYFLHLKGEIDAQAIMARMDSVKISVQRPAEVPEDSPAQSGLLQDILKVPLPVLTVIGWSTVFAATSIIAWSQARLRMQYR